MCGAGMGEQGIACSLQLLAVFVFVGLGGKFC